MKPGDMIGMSGEDNYVTLLVEVQKVDPLVGFEGHVVNGGWKFYFMPKTRTLTLYSRENSELPGFRVTFAGTIPDRFPEDDYMEVISYMNKELKKPMLVRHARSMWFATLAYPGRVKKACRAFVEAYRAYPFDPKPTNGAGEDRDSRF